MLNYVWLGLIVVAVLLGGITHQMEAVSNQVVEGMRTALDLAWKLFAAAILWLGLMRLAERAGLVHRLGRSLRPLMVWLFPEVPPDHPAMGSIIMNMAANILGLNNAATPLGLRAMEELESLNRRPGVATNAMCMLLAINTSSITLIPINIITILTLAHGRNPTFIIGTSLVATAIAHAAAITSAKLLENSPFYRLPPLPRETVPPEPKAAASDRSRGGDIARQQASADADLPWVPGSRWILAAFCGAAIGMWLGSSYPELIAWLSNHLGLPGNAPVIVPPVEPEPWYKFYLLRPLDALSTLAIPWLILFFPLYAALRRIPVYEELVEGGREAFNVVLRILPYIVGMLVAIFMFRAAGGEQLIKWMVSPVTSLIGFPAPLVPLATLRPFSGTGALAIFQDLVTQYGPNSVLTLTAATMYGCSETTFYVIAVYFGSVGVRKTRHAIPCGLIADVVGPLASVAICRLVFGPF